MKWSTSVSLMFREHPIAQRLQAARDAGFDGVEIQVLGESSADDWVNARQAAGIDVALVNVGMGDFLSGGPGLSGVPDREAEFRIEAEHTLNTARRLACCNVHVGPSRIPVGQTRAACLEVLVANLEWLRPKADEAGVRLLLEPLNRQEIKCPYQFCHASPKKNRINSLSTPPKLTFTAFRLFLIMIKN